MFPQMSNRINDEVMTCTKRLLHCDIILLYKEILCSLFNIVAQVQQLDWLFYP